MKSKTGVATVAALLALACPSTAMAGKQGRCRGSHLKPRRSNIATVTKATACLVNRVRRRHHLRPLRFSRALASVASGQSGDMVIGHYFGDNSLTGKTPLARIMASRYGQGSHTLSVAQNIAWGTGRYARPRAIMRSWMHSAPHRAILLDRHYRSIGIGIRLGTPSRRHGGAIYTADLATR